MKRRMILILFLVFPGLVYSQELKAIKLPEPKMQGGMPLMQALRERKSVREFATRELPIEVISDMLWAGAGINRPESAHRTSPSSMNMQEIDIYLVKAEGVYLYDPQGNMLIPVVSGDIRVLTGAQDFVKDAPVDLVYVADLARMGKVSPQDADSTAGTDTGFISQNVYLYCASSGLATVVRGWLDRPALAKAMKLRPQQKIILAQTVGYPK